MTWLRQSTAVTLKIGPFLDETDGKTAETGLTIAQADVRLSKNGGNIAQKHEGTSCTHDELGIYGCPLDTDDTDTLGILQLWVHESGALPVWHEYMVVPANVWDSLFGSDRLQVDVREKGDSSMGLTTQEKADVNAEADTALSDYDPPTKAELDSGFAALNDPTAGAVADAVWDEPIADHVGAGSFGTKNQKVVPSETLADYKADVSNLDVAVSTRSSHAAADIWSVVTRELTDKSGFSLSAAGIDSIIDEVVEGTITLRQATRLFLAALAGKSAGGGTSSIKFRDVADSKDRITATVDPDGNRTAVTRDVS